MPRVIIEWTWDEAFDKFGFGDGDGLVMTSEVESFLYETFPDISINSWGGIHNHFIQDINYKEKEYSFDGYDDPTTILPKEIVDALNKKFGESSHSMEKGENK